MAVKKRWVEEGVDAKGSAKARVPDTSLRVQSVANLQVANASVMPSITSGNTNATAIMMGEKTADLIAAEHRAAQANEVIEAA